MLYKRLIWLIKISFPDSPGHVSPEKLVEAGGAMQKLPLNSRWSWKKVTTIWKNIHWEISTIYILMLVPIYTWQLQVKFRQQKLGKSLQKNCVIPVENSGNPSNWSIKWSSSDIAGMLADATACLHVFFQCIF